MTFRDLFKKRSYFINMMMMTAVWTITCFDYYTIGFFMKYVKGDIYTNSLVSGLSMIPALLVSVNLYN